MRKNVLITGMPGSGKSTLLKQAIAGVVNKTGFITSEIRVNGVRTGFEIETSKEDKALLASVDFKNGPQVSKYRVKVENLNAIIAKISKFSKNDILYLDEIGQMELYSNEFRKLCLSYLDSTNICMSTISKIFNDEFTQKIKNRKDVILVEINELNREKNLEFINKLVEKIFKAKGYIKEPERFKKVNNVIILQSEHGTRTITKRTNGFSCTCDFYKSYSICSHIIAVEELLALEKI